MTKSRQSIPKKKNRTPCLGGIDRPVFVHFLHQSTWWRYPRSEKSTKFSWWIFGHKKPEVEGKGIPLFQGNLGWWNLARIVWGDTVDGNQKSGINSPVEVGSWNPLIYTILHHHSWLFGISSTNSTPEKCGFGRVACFFSSMYLDTAWLDLVFNMGFCLQF